MFAPDVEARFRKIEDDLAVTAELQRRAELRLKEEVEHLAAVQNALADSQRETTGKLNALIDAQLRSEAANKAGFAELRGIVGELARTVERFLQARTNGGPA